ncbi:MAG: cell division protein FtsZ [Clostridia bacterium]|nr:cell division protein FtsZ [Clostridia bacterium]
MYQDNTPVYGENNEHRSTEVIGRAKIRVIGVGGAGNNAVNNMIEAGIISAEYIAANTDAQALACNKAPVKIQLGAMCTKGLGAGADPEIGRLAAEENKEDIAAAIEGTDLLFIAAGMGGGTGTGAAHVIAKIAKDKKILTVAVVTKPFAFEGRRKMDNAMKGIDNLRKYVDTLVIIPNEKIMEVVQKTTSIADAFRVADEVLKQGIRGISDLIVTPGLINLDFADVRTILKDKGMAHMGVGVAKGENRIIEAVRLAVNSPLLTTTIEGATGVIINVVGGPDLTLDEVSNAARLVHGVVDYSANIIFGACVDDQIQDEVEITVIATGFPSEEEIEAKADYRVNAAPKPYGAVRSPYGGAMQESHEAPVAPAPAPAPVPEPAPQEVKLPEEDKSSRGIPAFLRRTKR